jgi:hypothetical protein
MPGLEHLSAVVVFQVFQAGTELEHGGGRCSADPAAVFPEIGIRVRWLAWGGTPEHLEHRWEGK